MSIDKNNVTVETLQNMADRALNNIFGEFAPFIRSGNMDDLPGVNQPMGSPSANQEIELPDLDFDSFRTKVTFHPYRTARVFGTRISLNRYNEDVRNFEHKLADAAVVSTYNHSAYTIDTEG